MLRVHDLVPSTVPTNVKEGSTSPLYSSTSRRDFPFLLSPPSLIHYQWMSYNLPYVFSFDSKCIKTKTQLSCSRTLSAILGMFSGLVRSLRSNKLFKKLSLVWTFFHQQINEPPLSIIVIQRPLFTLGFTLGVVNSVGLEITFTGISELQITD